jgi:hypothetical protein
MNQNDVVYLLADAETGVINIAMALFLVWAIKYCYRAIRIS